MMRPNRARAWDRALLALAALGALLAAGTIATARADTVLAVEGLMQRPGTTQAAFGGAFCQDRTCRSVGNPTSLFTAFSNVPRGASSVAAAVGVAEGPVTLLGWSLGAAAIEEQLRRWDTAPATAPAPERLRVVTFGAPEPRRDRNRAAVADPAPRYEHLNVVAQYDNIADRPDRWGWYSAINLSAAQHMSYQDADINDPDNLVHRDGQTTRMLIEAETLPMLRWLDPWVSDERMAQLDAKYRPRVERDYDRPDYVRQGHGADWANGVQPEVLRDDDEADDEHDVRDGVDADASQDTSPRRGVGLDVGPRGGEADEDHDQRQDRVAGDRGVDRDAAPEQGNDDRGNGEAGQADSGGGESE